MIEKLRLIIHNVLNIDEDVVEKQPQEKQSSAEHLGKLNAETLVKHIGRIFPDSGRPEQLAAIASSRDASFYFVPNALEHSPLAIKG